MFRHGTRCSGGRGADAAAVGSCATTGVSGGAFPMAGKNVGLCVHQFKHGQSNPTYLVEFGAQRMVLRKPPTGNILPSVHAVDREYRVMGPLWRGNSDKSGFQAGVEAYKAPASEKQTHVPCLSAGRALMM
ncbi:hypothetical protein DYB26_006440 [Aphanomyces astaci]|uniref:Uncharacterized protein n=1 Tax=Aphanomyces astaci TaxID=112090 RepID=A0A3R7B8K8_APHAT|nr:hypothetical protein DYB34_006547 [Aphanomyces astaci]RHZ31644.1 hypothetical protein DYB26_006440 [Aphanomyces astaci]